MNLRDAIIFVGGVGLGAVSTYFILKDRYNKQLNEETEEIKEYYKDLYSNKEETPSELQDVEIKIEDVHMETVEVPAGEEPNYGEIIEKLNYNQFSTTVAAPDGEERVERKPYLISMDEYNTDTRMIKKIISYFEDDMVCMDNDTKEVLTNIPKELGVDNLESINENGEGEIYIRNELLGIDYNVVSEPGSYEDYLEVGPDE